MCKHILDKINQISQSNLENWQQSWNAHFTIVTPLTVTIKSHYENTQCQISLEDFIQAIEIWSDATSQLQNSKEFNSEKSETS